MPDFMVNKVQETAEFKAYKKLMGESAEHLENNYYILLNRHSWDQYRDDLIVFVNAKQKILTEGTN